MSKMKKQTEKNNKEPIYIESQEILIAFYDYHNLEVGCRILNKSLDLSSLKEYLSYGRKSIEHIVYIGTNPLNLESSQKEISELKQQGFLVKTKLAKILPDNKLKCDFDSQIIIDAVEIAKKVKPDIVALASGDGDFVPLIEWLRYRGIRTEVASVDGTISQDLKDSANGYIDLTTIDLTENLE